MDSENNRLLLIINPVSGTSNKKELADKITSRLSAEGFEVETALTACRGDATRLARLAVDNGMAGVCSHVAATALSTRQRVPSAAQMYRLA